MRVKNLMTTPVVSCTENDSLSRAAQKMWETDCGCLPVVDREQRLVGVITDRDICMAALMRGQALESVDVASVMARDVFSCSSRSSVSDVERLLREKQIRRVPVVDDVGTVVGVITLGDLARYLEAKPLRGRLSAPRLLRTIASVYRPRPPTAIAAE